MNLTGKPPLGLKKQKPERGTKAAKEHLQRVKQLPCAICGAPPTSDAHHCIHDRYGTSKASDFDTIPLCKEHHQIGPNAIHNGKETWREKYGADHSYITATKRAIATP